MSLKIRQKLLAPNIDDGGVVASGTAVSTVAFLPKLSTRRFDADTIAVLAANDYGSIKIMDLPDRNIAILHVEVDLTLVKEGNTNGLVATSDLDVGVGTAAASNATLATTMINVLEKTDLNDDALTVQYEAVSLGQSTAAPPIFVADSATNALYLNVGGPNITADSSLEVTGFVDVYWVDLGNRAS
jgi:hypothetical protein